MHVHLKVEPFEACYYRIFSNSRTLLILLQVNPIFCDKPKTVCEGCYKIEDTSIFAWSLVPDVGHYRQLHSPFVDYFLIARWIT